MEAKQELEVTIRTAVVIKALSELIGRRDPLTIRLALEDADEKFRELAKFALTLK